MDACKTKNYYVFGLLTELTTRGVFMFQIDIMSRIPVYEQLIRQTEKFILLGVLKEGDKLPSVRQLSAELSINPNTIQKAFTELDRRGIIFSVNGRGNFVADKALKALEVSRRSAFSDIKDQIKDFALAGISRTELHEYIDEIYDEMGDKS